MFVSLSFYIPAVRKRPGGVMLRRPAGHNERGPGGLYWDKNAETSVVRAALADAIVGP